MCLLLKIKQDKKYQLHESFILSDNKTQLLIFCINVSKKDSIKVLGNVSNLFLME